MKLKFYHIDSFTTKLFQGNPAYVVPLEDWLPDKIMYSIAKENNVAETAFFIPTSSGFHIRWFTPEIEMDLCGHATLATAHVIKQYLNCKKPEILFTSLSGKLKVKVEGNGYTLNFPSRIPVKAELPVIIKKGLSIHPLGVYKSRDYLLIYDTEEQVRNIKVNKNILDAINLDPGGIIVTAKGDNVDFVSRFFTPQATIFEDPVTGSAHCSLVPFWSQRLKKNELTAWQISDRKGELFCVNKGSRVLITGKAVTYGIGTINI